MERTLVLERCDDVERVAVALLTGAIVADRVRILRLGGERQRARLRSMALPHEIGVELEPREGATLSFRPCPGFRSV